MVIHTSASTFHHAPFLSLSSHHSCIVVQSLHAHLLPHSTPAVYVYIIYDNTMDAHLSPQQVAPHTLLLLLLPFPSIPFPLLRPAARNDGDEWLPQAAHSRSHCAAHPLRPGRRHLLAGGRSPRRRRRLLAKHAAAAGAGDEALRLPAAAPGDPAFRPVGGAQLHRPDHGGGRRSGWSSSMSRHGLDETDPAAGGRRHFVNIKSSSEYARHIYALLATTGTT